MTRWPLAVLLAVAGVAHATEVPPSTGDGKLSLSGLAPASVRPNLCTLRCRISTPSKECQALFDQGLGYYYSYVWMEAARSFETAARHDPDCPAVWCALSRALDKWSKPKEHKQALERAQSLLARASHREAGVIRARLQEKGLLGDLKGQEAKDAAAKTLDEHLAIYDDDEEAWFARSQLVPAAAGVPFLKALAKLNPTHPGATHELVHHYERIQRPALGMAAADAYITSSPGIPHAFHMQAHLATRLGQWDQSTDRSLRAVELHREYFKAVGVKPTDDYQFGHHLEVLTLSLIHDGRFREARQIKAEAQAANVKQPAAWFRLALAEGDTAEAKAIADGERKRDKQLAAYLSALLALATNRPDDAKADIETLREAAGKRPGKAAEFRHWETHGLFLCQTGAADEGLKLLQRAAAKSQADYSHHSWGNGAYYMEAWGQAALAAGRLDAAEEAFLEALAHDAGSVRAALGLEAVCRKANRPDEAKQYATLARKAWRNAEVRSFEALCERCGVAE